MRSKTDSMDEELAILASSNLAHQFFTRSMRRRDPPVLGVLHDDENPHLLFPGRASVHCARIPETASQDQAMAVQLPVHDASGVCIIGMQKIAMLPLITFEVVVNIYLTLLFILPLRHTTPTQSSTAWPSAPSSAPSPP
ncbi:hypothetical protein OPT61_g5289 [Boeremia exigua]|uniref:Uncharacterized protein n=1 Tax=Boeremia exigua TaxID=749465 RepID=A0ACC2IB15_9PLEO|nr:hypothetical protein OPT61_g5289 [Boeremia exigua]